MSWEEYFLRMLPSIGSNSEDRVSSVGCVIVNADNSIVSTGYNSLVRGLDDTKVYRLNRPDKYTWIEHADRNAIYNAARIGVSTKGCTMYLPFYPCPDCSRGIVSSGIKRVVIGLETFYKRTDYLESQGRTGAWLGDKLITDTMFDECGVELSFV